MRVVLAKQAICKPVHIDGFLPAYCRAPWGHRGFFKLASLLLEGVYALIV